MLATKPNLRLKIQLLRSDLVLLWEKTEGKKGEKKGRKREKIKIEKDRDRKDFGKDKAWKYKKQSLFVVDYFLLFVYIYQGSGL